MKKLLFLTLIALHTQKTISQTNVIKVNAGENIKEKLGDQIYLYSSFQQGRVHFKNGDVYGALINYNRLRHAIEFIDDKKDTLLIANQENLKAVYSGTDTFYFDKSYFKLRKRYGNFVLAEKEYISMGDIQKIGAYGLSSPAGSIQSSQGITPAYNNTIPLTANEDIIFLKGTVYYIQDKDHFIRLSKKTLIKSWPSKKELIDAYTAKENLNLNNYNDIDKLLSYISGN